MQFSLAFLTAAMAASVGAITVSYDTTYDNASGSTLTTSCSDGSNGLSTKGYQTFGSLPAFPMIGGAFTIAGWNDPNCGKCYQLTYNGNSIHVLAVDHVAEGFNIAEEAMNALTNGQAEFLGRIDADYSEVDVSACGM